MHQIPTIPSPFIASGSDIRDLFHLFQKAPVGMVIFKGPTLVIEYLNEKILEIWDRRKEEVFGRPLFDCFPELTGSEVEKVLMNVFRKGEKFKAEEFEASFFRKGKLETVYCDFSAEPMQNSERSNTGVMVVITDMTVQVKSRKKLEESEALLRKTKEQLELSISAGKVGIWHWDAKHNVLTWSKEQFEIFGVSPAEFNGKAEDFFDYILPEDRPRINAASRLEFERSDNQYEFRIRRKDGAIRWIQSRSKTFLNKDGVAEYITGINIDITEQRSFSDKLENEVAERTKELVDVNRRLLEAQQLAQLGSWELDYETGEVTWSNELYSIYGYGEEKFPVTIEKAMERMLPEEVSRSKERMKLHFKNALTAFKEERTVAFDIPPSEYTIILPGGYSKILRSIGKILLTEEGKINKMLGTIQDITDQRKAEEEIRMINRQLEKQNNFVETILDSSTNGITVYDKELRFVKMNRAAERFLNNTSEKLIGKKITEVFPEIETTSTYQVLLKALEGEYIHLNNHFSPISQRYFDSHLIPLKDANGQVYGLLTSGHDITENIQQMEELRKALEADKLKSDFIKMASHELKTPITSIKGYVQLLLAMVKEKEDQKSLSPLFVKSSLVNIEKQVNRLTRLMSELLDLSKIESGQLELNREEFNLNELVIDVVQDVLYTNPKHRINVYHDYSTAVSGDKDRIGQVLVNLLNNAIKYSPDADKIEVTIYQPETKQVAVSIKDFGIGIDKKDFEKIFERFYRAEGAAEQTFPGFGIGLFIAKEMVKRHEGTLVVESEKRKGSVFTFTLPIGAKM
jgi:PAS domain S-box-containing protein